MGLYSRVFIYKKETLNTAVWMRFNNEGIHQNDLVNHTFTRFNGADLRNVCTEAGLFAIR